MRRGTASARGWRCRRTERTGGGCSSPLHLEPPEATGENPAAEENENGGPGELLAELESDLLGRDVTHVHAEGDVDQAAEGEEAKGYLRPVGKERDRQELAGEDVD